MAKQVTTKYICDKCKTELDDDKNLFDIKTSITTEPCPWLDLHVQIVRHYYDPASDAVWNPTKLEPADLCTNCAANLLKAALIRVEAGEKALTGFVLPPKRQGEA